MTTPRDDDAPLTPADRAAMGQHAAPRPTPPPPGSRPDATDVPAGPRTGEAAGPPAAQQPAAAPGAAPAEPPSAPPPGTPATRPTPPPPPTSDATRADDGPRADSRPLDDRPLEERHDLPEAPDKPGVGRHLLGVLLGLLLTPVALLLTAIGTARLSEVAGTADMGTDTLGIAMLVIGLALLAVIVLLGAWTPALPITGGVVWGLGLGIAYLVVPGIMQDTVENLFGGSTPAAAEELADTAMSGQLVLVGTLLLAAGLATAFARRRGRRWAEGVAEAEAARTRAVAGERDRIRVEADRRSRRG